MYARLVIFKVGPGNRSTIESLVDEFDHLYRSQPGFKHVSIVGDKARGEYGSFSIWESKKDADAANAVVAPQLQQALTGLLQGTPDRWFLRCLNPKGETATNKRVPPGGSGHSPQFIHPSAWKGLSPKFAPCPAGWHHDLVVEREDPLSAKAGTSRR